MCDDCKTLTLATDPRDDSKLKLWLPHNDDDLAADHIWIGITEDPEDGTESYETSIMLNAEEQDQLIAWIKDRRSEHAGQDN